MPFLPITREEMKERGIEQFDFVYVIGDGSYLFLSPFMGRILQSLKVFIKPEIHLYSQHAGLPVQLRC